MTRSRSRRREWRAGPRHEVTRERGRQFSNDSSRTFVRHFRRKMVPSSTSDVVQHTRVVRRCADRPYSAAERAPTEAARCDDDMMISEGIFVALARSPTIHRHAASSPLAHPSPPAHLRQSRSRLPSRRPRASRSSRRRSLPRSRPESRLRARSLEPSPRRSYPSSLRLSRSRRYDPPSLSRERPSRPSRPSRPRRRRSSRNVASRLGLRARFGGGRGGGPSGYRAFIAAWTSLMVFHAT